MSDIINNAFASLDPYIEKFVSKNVDIVEEVYDLIKEKGYSQKEFAALLGKSPSEISKWLSGMHNLTLRSIARMEMALGEDIIITSSNAKKKYEKINYVHVNKDAVRNSPIAFQRDSSKSSFTPKKESILMVA